MFSLYSQTILSSKKHKENVSVSSKNILQIINEVEKTINKKQLILSRNNIVCAISGGQDSSFLLFCLSFLKVQRLLSFKIIWCNHFWQSCSFYTTLHLTKCAVAFSSPIIGFLPFQNHQSPLFFKSVRISYKKKSFSQLESKILFERHANLLTNFAFAMQKRGSCVNLCNLQKPLQISNQTLLDFSTKKLTFAQRKQSFTRYLHLTYSPLKSPFFSEKWSFSRPEGAGVTNQRFVRATKKSRAKQNLSFRFYKTLFCQKVRQPFKVLSFKSKMELFEARRGKCYKYNCFRYYKYKSSYKSLICTCKEICQKVRKPLLSNKALLCKKICKKICTCNTCFFRQKFTLATYKAFYKTKFCSCYTGHKKKAKFFFVAQRGKWLRHQELPTKVYAKIWYSHYLNTKAHFMWPLLHSKSQDKPKGYKKFVKKVSETRARNWRHIAIQRGCSFYYSKTCVYGHTGSDRVETILFNLIRGSGSRGIACLPWKRRYSYFCYNKFYPSYKQVLRNTHLYQSLHLYNC